MDGVTIYLAKALICFAQVCHPVLLGENTQPGVYAMRVLWVASPGYGPNVLEFDRMKDGNWLAIHQTYSGNGVKRAHLYTQPAANRRHVTAGCPNVQPEVYQQLLNDHANATLTIVP